MDYISKIAEMYHENILLQPQYTGGNNLHPLCQRWDLRNDGNPKTGEIMPIGWIVYPYEMIRSDTAFYRAEYKIDGIIFSDDGAGNPFILKPDGAVVCFNAIDGEEVKAANSLSAFWTANNNP